MEEEASKLAKNFFKEIKENIVNEDVNEFLDEFSSRIENTNEILLLSCGRSRDSAFLLLDPEFFLRYFKKKIYDPLSRTFPASSPKSFVEMFPETFLFVISGSGKTPYIVENLSELARKIKEKRIALITGRKGSPADRIVRGKKGIVLYLGLGKRGILRDIFECSVACLSVFLKSSIKELIKDPIKCLENIFKVTEKGIENKNVKILLEKLLTRGKLIIAGTGKSEAIASAAAIRLNHIKGYFGDTVQIAGELTGEIRKDDLVVFITFSGMENRIIKRWYEESLRKGASIFFLSPKKIGKSPTITIPTDKRDIFYPAAYILTTLIALFLKREFEKKGFVLEPRVKHSLFV